jgi:hypothetical protein
MTFWKQKRSSVKSLSCILVGYGDHHLQSCTLTRQQSCILPALKMSYNISARVWTDPKTSEARILWIIHQVVHRATTVVPKVTAQWSYVGLPPALTLRTSAIFPAAFVYFVCQNTERQLLLPQQSKHNAVLEQSKYTFEHTDFSTTHNARWISISGRKTSSE